MRRIPDKFGIYDIISMYEDGINGSPEAIIFRTNYDIRSIYRIIYNYRSNLIPVTNYLPGSNQLYKLLEPVPYPHQEYNVGDKDV